MEPSGLGKGFVRGKQAEIITKDKARAPLGEDLQIVHFVGTLSPRLAGRWGWWLRWNDW
jgi:hypothetical protein